VLKQLKARPRRPQEKLGKSLEKQIQIRWFGQDQENRKNYKN